CQYLYIISAITYSLFGFCSVVLSGISVLCYVLVSICLTLSVICKVNIAKVVCNAPLRLFSMRRTIIHSEARKLSLTIFTDKRTLKGWINAIYQASKKINV